MGGIQNKKEELENEFKLAGIDVLIITETKKKGKTIRKTINEHVIFSGRGQ